MATYGTDTTLPPLVIVHGLFGSGRNWRAIARRMAARRRVVTPDLRNHGGSFHAASHSYEEMAADLARLVEALGGEADMIGHSMGGKAAMVLALTRPKMLRRLVVADIAPVAYDHSQAHLVEAMRALEPGQFESRAAADAALARHVDDPHLRAFLLQSLDLTAGKWRLNLEVLARDMPLITGFPPVHGRFTGPTLFLSGAESSYVLPTHRERIKLLFPNARFAKIPGAGHWLHAERPRAFIAVAEAFLND